MHNMKYLIYIVVLLTFISFVTADSMWVWNKENYILEETDELIRFSNAINVNELYLHFTSSQLQDPKVPDVIQQLNKEGFKVHYLTGDRPWVFGNVMEERVQNLVNFNLKNGNLFEGIHFDIERNDWFQNDNAVAISFLSNLKKIKQTYPKVKVSLDIPFWLDSHDSSKPFAFNGKTALFSTHLRDYTSFLTIMDYRTSGEEIVKLATEIKEGPTVIGLEFGDTEPKEITFWGKGLQKYVNEKKIAAVGFSTNFEGFSFHYYKELRTFLRDEGDYNLDGTVDGEDILSIKKNVGSFVLYIKNTYPQDSLPVSIHKYLRVMSSNWGLSF
jgi:hypothetical protein